MPESALFAFTDFAKAKLDQMIRFELAAGPAVSIFKMDPKQVIYLFGLAVFNACFTAIVFKLEMYSSAWWNKFFELETCSGRGNVFEDCPLITSGTGFGLPLDFYQISAKLSIFLSSRSHD